MVEAWSISIVLSGWRENLSFQNLRQHLQIDADFAAKLARCLESIIKCSVNPAADDLDDLKEKLTI